MSEHQKICKVCEAPLTTDDLHVAQGYCSKCATTEVTPMWRNKPKDSGACLRCGDHNHSVRQCRTKLCKYCGIRGHTKSRCFSNPENCCSRCGTFGHTETQCKLCDRCGDFGHDESRCRTKLCQQCGKRGHLSKTCWFNKVCDRCGIKGHISSACKTRLIGKPGRSKST